MCLLALCVASSVPIARAAEPGKAVGTVTISGVTTPLAFAVETRKENLFDSKRQDTVVVLSDKPLGKTAAEDEIELSMRARTGELVVLALRIDGDKLVNVQMSHKGLSGIALLPGAWFQYNAAKPGVGGLKLDSREFDVDQTRESLAVGRYYCRTASRRIRHKLEELGDNDDAETNSLANLLQE